MNLTEVFPYKNIELFKRLANEHIWYKPVKYMTHEELLILIGFQLFSKSPKYNTDAY